MFGPDVIASITMDELAHVVEGKRAFQIMKDNPVDKNSLAGTYDDMRRVFTKSLALKASLPEGTILTADMLTVKKPGTGIPPSEIDNVIGRQLCSMVPFDRLLTYEDLSEIVKE